MNILHSRARAPRHTFEVDKHPLQVIMPLRPDNVGCTALFDAKRLILCNRLLLPFLTRHARGTSP